MKGGVFFMNELGLKLTTSYSPTRLRITKSFSKDIQWPDTPPTLVAFAYPFKEGVFFMLIGTQHTSYNFLWGCMTCFEETSFIF
jgi:hypothetical protein